MKVSISCVLICLTVVLTGIACAAISTGNVSRSVATQPMVTVTVDQNLTAPSMLKSTDIALSQAYAEPDTSLTLINAEVTSKSKLASDFANLKRTDRLLALADKDLVKRGFKAQTKDENFFGFTEVYKVRSKTTGKETQQKLTMSVQDYFGKSMEDDKGKPPKQDLGALVRITLEAEGQRETYTFNVVAVDGNFDNVVEYAAVETPGGKTATGGIHPARLEMLKTNSWWSCVRGQIREHCSASCRNALTECHGGWASYIGCVAWRCGGCYVAKSACCTCNCKWWCKWATGCCHR